MSLKLHRVGLVCLIAVILCAALLMPAYGDQSAADLLKQAIQQMDSGQYAQAQDTLKRIDRVQLDDAQRVQYDDASKSLTTLVQAQGRLDQALAAEKEGKLEDAKQLYRQLTADTSAPRKVRTDALNGLARVERALMDGKTTTTIPAAAAAAPQPAAPVKPVAKAEPTAPVEPAATQAKPTVAAAEPKPAAKPAAAAKPTVAVEAKPADAEPAVVAKAAPAPAPAPAKPSAAEIAAAQKKAADEAAAMLAQAKALEVQRLLAEADQAAAAGQYNDSLKLYEKALAIDPANGAAAKGAENIKVVQAKETGVNVLADLSSSYQIRRQQAIARYEEKMASAQQALDASNYARATDEASMAKTILDTSHDYLPESEYLAKRQAALDLAAKVATVAKESQAKLLEEQQKTLADRAAEERAAAQASRYRKVQELLRQARDLARDQKYDRALEQIEQIKFIDPNNVAAQFMEDVIIDQKLAGQVRTLRRVRGVETARQNVENFESTIPYNDLMTYPSDWPELTYTRLNGQNQSTDSEANRVSREKLQQPIPVDFRANQLANVIEYLRNVTGANIVVQWRSLEAAGISRETPITMQLNNVAADRALRLILDEAGGDLVKLGYTIDEGVIVIATNEFLAAKTEIRTYDIRDLIVQVPNFDQAPEFDLTAVASDQGGNGGGGTSIFTDNSTDEDVVEPRADRIAAIEDLLKNSVARDSWVPVGLTSSMEELNGTLIISTTSDNHIAIARLLRQLREQRALQIAVDARFLFVTQNFLEEVGFDVDFTWTGKTPSWLDGQPTAQQDTLAGATAQGTNVGGTIAPLTASSLIFGAALPGGGVGALGFILDDLRVDVMIKATQKDIRNITVNTPRLTFFNSQRANIVISRQTAFVSDLEAVVASSAVAFNPTISVVSDGVVLDVEGTISADRRYVTLTLRPSLAQLVDLKEFAVNASSGTTDDGTGGTGGTGGGTTTDTTFATGTLQQPEIALTQVSTTVSIPDKGTLLIGGQRLVGDVEVEQGVPVLSRIPVINRLFSNRSKTHDERTLLILVKPTIIVQFEQEERLFPGLNSAPGLYNLGVHP